MPAVNTIATNPLIKIGTAAGGSQIKSVPISQAPEFMEVLFDFVATGSTTHVTVYGALDTEIIYADNVSVILTEGLSPKYLYPKGFTCVTEWQDGTEVLRVTTADGVETNLTNLGSKSFQADRYYPLPGWSHIRSNGGTESGSAKFEIVVFY